MRAVMGNKESTLPGPILSVSNLVTALVPLNRNFIILKYEDICCKVKGDNKVVT